MSDKYVPRISIDITPEMQTRLQRLLPWGLRGKLFLVMVEDILDLIEEHGEGVVALLITKRLKARTLLMKELEDGAKGPKGEHHRDADG